MEAKVLETIDKEKLYTDHHDMVLGYIMHHIGNLDVAEDLCSDVFVKAYSALDRFDPSKASVSTWLYTIMRNTLTDYYRRNTMTDEIPEDVESGDNIESAVMMEASLDALADALKDLPQRQRDIIVLRYYDEHTLLQIADMMDTSYGIIKIEHRKALNALKKKLKDI